MAHTASVHSANGARFHLRALLDVGAAHEVAGQVAVGGVHLSPAAEQGTTEEVSGGGGGNCNRG